ncbi:hypothetical protein ADUPG1_011068 [Aduncisulcus paluster]|uniref:Uncharacterized protein n=1 Tax=Aduncisulcus paluster TaxID=2918883 RepID=A0ABQ5JWS7_9EUKA|nr:hypothetical protein ADUPG1_011068 [Aduncisulcus paluster]|eukprot:gnl/Carplike_NY0171/2950_a3970_496.p1 GENE.gnl/Carplike_NY0171/2950_a3970_496~~gnl/Carplike_NY0171/2950_a3970_496.p1  ORF type:complete len:152 (-),score=40.09 gnl/Carplike_NY0171/2950_a3970_496:106-561(-)
MSQAPIFSESTDQSDSQPLTQKNGIEMLKWIRKKHTETTKIIEDLKSSNESEHKELEDGLNSTLEELKTKVDTLTGVMMKLDCAKKISVTLPHTSHSKRSPPLSLSTHPGDFSVNGEKGYEKEKEEKEEDDKIMDSSKKKRSNTPTLPPVK